MANAMINEKYMQATLPTLSLPHSQSHLRSHQSTTSHSSIIRQPTSLNTNTNSNTNPSSITTSAVMMDCRNPSNTASSTITATTTTTSAATTSAATTATSTKGTIAPSIISTHQHQQQQHQQQLPQQQQHQQHNPRKSKAVNFDLPLSKKSRRSRANDISNVISAIQTCISSSDRLDAIYDACSKFDHNVEATHDAEIAMGADIALFKHLPLLILKKQRLSQQLLKQQQQQRQHHHQTSIDSSSANLNSSANNNATTTNTNHQYVAILEEISNTFTALEMVLRCSAESISTCFARIGDELLQILINFIQELSVDLSKVALESHQESPPSTTSTSTSTSSSSSPPPLSPPDPPSCTTTSNVVAANRSRSPTTVTANNTTTTAASTVDDDMKMGTMQEQEKDFDRSSKTSTPTASCDESAIDHTEERNDNNNNNNNNTKGKLPSSSSSSRHPKQQIPMSPISSTNNPSIQTASTVILKTCTKIIGHFARVGSLTETLANTNGLLDALCDVITISHNIGINTSIDDILNNDNRASGNGSGSGNSSGGSVSSASTLTNDNNNIPIEATLNCLWIIANLACSVENMILMSRNHKITNTLFEIASHPNEYEEKECQDMDIDRFINLIRTRSVAVRGILNLSWAMENKIPLTENITLVDDLLRIASHRKSPWAGTGKGVSGILLQSRRHACGTLRNLAAAPRKYKRRLCRLRGGRFLEALADIARNDYDVEVRDKIHATLFNLVSADTAKMFTEKKEVLDVIISAATSPEEKEGGGAVAHNNHDRNNNTNSRGSKAMAENTLRSLEKALPEDDEGYDALRPTLSRFDSQITMNRSISNLGSVTISVTNLGTLPSISNFSLGDISHSNLNPETV